MFILHTSRLILRDFEQDDWRAAHLFSADPDVTHYMDYIKSDSEEQTQQWIRGMIFHNQLQPRVSYNLAVIQQADNQLIGWIGIGQAHDQPGGNHSFGYALNRSYWGRGYATEALQGLLEIGFSKLEAHKIFGECDAANLASARVMEKAGMRFEAYLEERDEATGTIDTTLRYSLHYTEWVAQQQS